MEKYVWLLNRFCRLPPIAQESEQSPEAPRPTHDHTEGCEGEPCLVNPLLVQKAVDSAENDGEIEFIPQY